MGNRLSRIYTRTGDDGTTGLGDGARVRKDNARVEAYGTVDEANSAIGIAQRLFTPSRSAKTSNRPQFSPCSSRVSASIDSGAQTHVRFPSASTA